MTTAILINTPEKQASFCDFLAAKLGTRKWTVKPRLTAKLQARGYRLAISQEKFTALRAEFFATADDETKKLFGF